MKYPIHKKIHKKVFFNQLVIRISKFFAALVIIFPTKLFW